jgi:hypothetical protein
MSKICVDECRVTGRKLKGGQHKNKVQKSQICKICELKHLLDQQTFRKCSNLQMFNLQTQSFCHLQICNLHTYYFPYLKVDGNEK